MKRAGGGKGEGGRVCEVEGGKEPSRQAAGDHHTGDTHLTLSLLPPNHRRLPISMAAPAMASQPLPLPTLAPPRLIRARALPFTSNEVAAANRRIRVRVTGGAGAPPGTGPGRRSFAAAVATFGHTTSEGPSRSLPTNVRDAVAAAMRRQLPRHRARRKVARRLEPTGKMCCVLTGRVTRELPPPPPPPF